MIRDPRRLIACALVLATCAAAAVSHALAQAAQPGAQDALMRLSCDDVGATAVSDVLAHADAPRVILISGSLPAITMDSFARFLAAMGYPVERLRDPRDGAFTQSG